MTVRGECTEGWMRLVLLGMERGLGIECESHVLVVELTLMSKMSLFYCYSPATCSHSYSRHVIIKSCGEPLENLQLITKINSFMFIMIKQSIESFELILPKTFPELLLSRSCHGLEAFKSPFCFYV